MPAALQVWLEVWFVQQVISRGEMGAVKEMHKNQKLNYAEMGIPVIEWRDIDIQSAESYLIDLDTKAGS